MRVEILIYLYGAVCASMIVFNVIYNLLLRGSEPRMERRCRKMKGQLDRQLDRIKMDQTVEETHMTDLPPFGPF